MITLNNKYLVSLAVLAACGLGNPAWCQGYSYSLLDSQTNSSAPGAVEKLPTGLMDGAQLGNPADVYSGIKNYWNDDPVSRAFKNGIDLTVQTGNGLLQQVQQPAATMSAPTGDVRYQPSSGVQADALNQQNLQLQQPGQQAAQMPRTPNGRFDYYRPIFEQQARRLNEEQRQQQQQYRDYLRSKYLLQNSQ